MKFIKETIISMMKNEEKEYLKKDKIYQNLISKQEQTKVQILRRSFY